MDLKLCQLDAVSSKTGLRKAGVYPHLGDVIMQFVMSKFMNKSLHYVYIGVF